MNKNEFLGMKIDEQIKFVNARTRRGMKVSEVAKKIGIGDKTLRTKIKKAGYTFDRAHNVYVLYDDFSMTDDTMKKEERKDDSHTNVVQKEEMTKVINKNTGKDTSHTTVIKREKKRGDNSHANVFSKEEIGVLKEMIKEYMEDDKSHIKDIEITLPQREESRTTIRVNSGAWEKFEGFANRHSEFKKKDLISMALLEYIKNHE